jgi:hypothetical protein
MQRWLHLASDPPLPEPVRAHCTSTLSVKETIRVPFTLPRCFWARMVERKAPGFIAFTSSSAGFVPNPLSILYPSTKSFMTLFATSLYAAAAAASCSRRVAPPPLPFF